MTDDRENRPDTRRRGCPNCGNAALENAEVRVASYREGHGRGAATFKGYRCRGCGHEWSAAPGSVLTDFDPPKGQP